MTNITLGSALVIAFGLTLLWLVHSTKDNLHTQLVLISIPVLLLWENPNDILLASIQGNSVYYLDVLSIYLLGVMLFKGRRFFRVKRKAWWYAYAGAVLLSALGGLLYKNYSVVVVEARSTIAALVVLIWSMNVDWAKNDHRVLKVWTLWFAIALMAVGALHLAIHGLGNSDDLVSLGQSGLVQTSRLLTSQQAACLLFCTLVQLRVSRSRLKFGLTAFSVVFLALAQQRTVWVVGLTVLALAVIYSKDKLRSLISIVIPSVLGGFLVLNYFSSVSQALLTSSTSGGTLGARNDSWEQLVQPIIDKGAPQTILFGSPFGSGFLRFLADGSYATYNPHNFYVFIFLRTGIVGLVILLIGMFQALMRSQKNTNRTSAMILVASAVYGFTYNLDFELTVFFGLATSLSLVSDFRLAGNGRGLNLNSTPPAHDRRNISY